MHQKAPPFRLMGMDKLKPSQELRERIIAQIAQEEHRLAKIYLLMSSLIFSASLTGVILSLKYLIQGLYQSGFYQYISILFSGDDMVLEYWKELSLSLIETLPVVGTIAFLTAFGFFIWSGVKTGIHARRFVLSTY